MCVHTCSSLGLCSLNFFLFWVVVSCLSSLPTATLSIELSRLVFSDNNPGLLTFPVEGLATVQIGGTAPPSYYLDCLTTADTKDNLRWSRGSGQLIMADQTEDSTVGTGLRLGLNTVDHTELDVYMCTDISTGDMVQVNVTDGEYNKVLGSSPS